jgi:hypothetical protein
LNALGLIALIGAGLALRLWAIEAFWLNPDEGTAYAVAAAPGFDGFVTSVAANAHPPLYYLVLRGLLGLGVDPLWIRLPGLVAGCLAIPAFFAGMHRLSGARAAWVAAGLAAFAPGLVLLSQVARQYVPELALLAGGAWLLLRYRNEGRRLDALGASLLLLGAALTHYSAVVFVGALALVLAGAAALRRLSGGELRRLSLPLVPAIAALAGFAAIHVVPEMLGSPTQAGVRARLASMLHDDAAGLWAGFVGVNDYIFGPRLGALALLLSVVGLGSLAWRRHWMLPALAVATVGGAAGLSLLGAYPLGASRHSLHLAVVLVPAVAEGVGWLLGQRPLRVAAVAGGLLLLAAVPGPLRAVLAAPRSPIELETVAPRATFERQAARLAAAAREPTVLVMDKQTYYMLLPLLGEVDLGVVYPAPGEPLARIDWGPSTLLVAQVWTLVTQPRAGLGAGHLVGLLEVADAAHPDLALRERRQGWLLFGGWGAPAYRGLARLDQRLAGTRPCFELPDAWQESGVVRFDPSACLGGARGWR